MPKISFLRPVSRENFGNALGMTSIHYLTVCHNQKENDDDKEMVASSNSLLEKANGQDQWVEGLKSKLNDRRVQFKRKRDVVGYRINPETDDIAKSLVKPSDFKFLDEADSDEYLSKWKSLKMDQQKPYSIKRFKPYS